MDRPLTAAVRLLTGERQPVRVATTGNIDLSGLDVVDGVSLTVGDRVLVKNQADARENGIYTASTGRWYRASDANWPEAIDEGVTVQVMDGIANAGKAYRFSSRAPVFGEDEIVIDFYLSANFAADANALIAANKADLSSFVNASVSSGKTQIEASRVDAISSINAAREDSLSQQRALRDETSEIEGRAQNLVDFAQAAYVGFQPGTFYDLGRVTDNTELFASDLGRVTNLA